MTPRPVPPAALSPERWQRVQDVLAAAIDSAADDRQGLLEVRCGDDVALRREVDALLAAHDGRGLIDDLADALAPAATLARANALGWQGRRVGQYVVLDRLGAGGMGIVYKAFDERLARHVALKCLFPHLGTRPAAKAQFLVEARAAAALDHPNVCTIHEIGETDDGQLFFAMPLYEGETLAARLRRGRLAFDAAIPIALQIARGLGCAHERGVVHRDIKPSNVMLLPDGTAKILDFGIATMEDDPGHGEGGSGGTFAYMSPEHLRGDLTDQRADIWSLGIVLHEMLAGVRPFDGDDRATLTRAILDRDPELSATAHPDVPATIDHVLRRALAKPPNERYGSMSMLATELATLASAPDQRSDVAPDDRSEQAPLDRVQSTLPASERRRAAVLVTIVSDYDALVEQLTPADAFQLMAQVRDEAVAVVRRHGGLVNQAIGEEIVSLFGVPIAHDDDEVRAVRAALELHARVRELRTMVSADSTVRIQSGIQVGTVVAQRLIDGPRRYAIVGAPAKVASRLAALANPDAVVLSPECQRLVAPFVHTAPCAPVTLEPGAPPVTAFRVTSETGLETRLEAAERSGLTPYVGRQAELAELAAHLERAPEKGGRVITVVGEAGAGKSRLLYELRARVAGLSVAGLSGVRLLHGRCRAYGGVTPYFPFIEIVREALGVRPLSLGHPDDLIARIRAMDPSLESFVPLYLHLLSVPTVSHPLPRHLQGEHLQSALLEALAALIGVLASRTTLALLVEDWHWADAASREALARIAEIVPAHPLVVVLTMRPDGNPPGERRARDAQLRLEPLDLAASTAIVRAVLRAERVSDALARRLFERTGGNPFFLEQVCCALREQGAVAAPDSEAMIEGGADTLSLPDTVQAAIRTRLDNLQPAAREVLRVAAVIGRDFERMLVAEGCRAGLDLASALVRLNASGLIEQTSSGPLAGYRFTHVLTQEVSYDGLLEHQRRSLHGVVGRAIERHHADRIDEKAALLAYHFERAGAWPEAVRYGRRAAQRASALSQFAEALTILDRVMLWLAHLPDEDARRDAKAELLLQQERECETLGLRGRQRAIVSDLIAHLAPHGPSARLAEAYLRQGDLLTLLKRFDAADRALSTARRVSREQQDAALERNTLRSIGLLRWHEGRHAEALALTEDALTMARTACDTLAIAGDLTNLGCILKSMGDQAQARARLEEALAMPSLARDPKKLAFVLHSLANVHRAVGDLELALVCLRRADEVCRTHLLPIQRSFHLTSIAHIDLQQGHVERALHTYRAAIELSRRARHAQGLANSLRTLGEVLFGLGNDEAALPYLQEAALLFAQLEDAAAEADMLGRAATVLARARRPAESREAWARARTLCQQLGDTRGQLDALEGMAQALRQLGASPEVVVTAFETALDLASTLDERGRTLALRNTLGIIEWTRGRYERARAHYEAALPLAREHPDAAQAAVILNSLGATLTRLDRPEEARTALEESIALTHAAGQRLLEAHALSALGQLSRQAGRLDGALHYFERSLELRRGLGDRIGEAWMLHRVAEATAALGRPDAARDASAAAWAIAVESGDADLVAACSPAVGTP